jgi:hypothetical protein
VLPLVKLYTNASRASEECLWRQFESFHSPGLPTSSCIVADLLYQRAPGPEKLVVDDFQTNSSTTQSSSNGLVSTDLLDLSEGRLDDPNNAFTHSASELMNGMTFSGGVGDVSAGAVLSWDNQDHFLSFDLSGGPQDVRAFEYLSFRACQTARHPLTTAALGDLVFSLRLRDVHGRHGTVRIDSYGGGIEEPYQRTACGTGAGWANEWETVRVRLEDFTRDGNRLDLRQIAAIDFLFGPSFGAAQGRIGLDEVELTN